MKVLIVSQYWHPENGVPQRRWTWLSKSLVEAGHQVKVVAPPAHYERAITYGKWLRDLFSRNVQESEEGISGETIVRTGYLPAGKSLTARIANQACVAAASLSAIAFQRNSLKTYDPDVIIGTVPALPTAVVTQFAGLRFRAPYIIDLRDAWPELLEKPDQWNHAIGKRSIREKVFSHGPLQFTTGITKIAIDNALRNASGIVLTSSHLKESLLVKRELETNQGKVPAMEVVRNVFPPETRYVHSVSKHEGTSGYALNVLYAGTLGRAQNLKNAIEAVQIANDLGVNVAMRLVGAGATKSELSRLVREKKVPVSIESRHSADELESHYQWADTALVHLSNWVPLRRAVPSKTYELMESGIHISGVVSGETEQLIRSLQAGHVIEPDNPRALAELWIELSKNRELLQVSNRGRDWVQNERIASTKRLHALLEQVAFDG